MQFIECREGEGLVIGEDVVVNIAEILEDGVFLEVQAEKVEGDPPLECDASDGETRTWNDEEKNAA